MKKDVQIYNLKSFNEITSQDVVQQTLYFHQLCICMIVGLVWAGVPEPMKARGVGCPLARATGTFWPPDRVQDSNLCPYPKQFVFFNTEQ